jgi:hypothetical protein
MTVTLLLQSAIVGITNGFVYALVGLGIAVVFRGTRIINAMQGEFSPDRRDGGVSDPRSVRPGPWSSQHWVASWPAVRSVS